MLAAWLIRWAGLGWACVGWLVTGPERGSIWAHSVGDAVLGGVRPGPCSATKLQQFAAGGRLDGFRRLQTGTWVELEMRLPGRRFRDLSRRSSSNDPVPGYLIFWV